VLDGPKGEGGRTVSLDVTMDKSRIEDIMTMAVKTSPPPMTGAMKMTTKFLQPPGDKDVVERLQLGRALRDRSRHVSRTTTVQGKIRRAEQARQRQDGGDDARARRVQFPGALQAGERPPDTARPHVCSVPGATVQLAGTYSLPTEALDFTGNLLLDAKISQMVTGMKSMILSPWTRCSGRKTAPAAPFPSGFGGTQKAPEFGLDVKKVLKKGTSPLPPKLCPNSCR
jgi:hypothetical protein